MRGPKSAQPRENTTVLKSAKVESPPQRAKGPDRARSSFCPPNLIFDTLNQSCCTGTAAYTVAAVPTNNKPHNTATAPAPPHDRPRDP